MQQYDRHYYSELGLEPIPLWHGLKTPARKYNSIPWQKQWEGLLGRADDYNVGLRLTDGPFIILDGDSPETRMAIEGTFKTFGLPHEPTARTGGGHLGWQWWLTCPDKPGISKAHYKLHPNLGDGEILVRNCLAVVPPSEVEAKYHFLVPDPATHLQREVIWKDLFTMVAPQKSAMPYVRPDIEWTAPAIPILTFKLKDHTVVAHTRQIELSEKGDPTGRYPCRCRAMGYVVRMLLFLGWNWANIRAHFEELAPNYLAEKEWQIHYTASNFSGQMTPPCLIEAYKTAAGLMQRYDRACYRALISEAARWNGHGEIEGTTAVAETTDRNLARLMRSNHRTAGKARHRLEAAGLVHVLDVGAFHPKRGKRSRYMIELGA